MENRLVEAMFRTYGDTLFRLCLVMLGNESDAEDAVQETVLKYIRKAPSFDGAKHEKAWLLKVAANQCRDIRRFSFRHPQVSLEDMTAWAGSPEESGILDALTALPPKFRLVLVLHYVEGYKVDEIATVIGRSPSAVKMRLQKGRRLLEETYRKEYGSYGL